MDGPFDSATAAGLAEALRLDPGLAAEPERLRRVLADLSPFDERGGWLLALGAAAGVPALIERGEAAEAHSRLCDLGACRADAAGWAVSAWAAALGRESPNDGREVAADADEWSYAGPGAESPGLAEEPGAPTALRVALWRDGGPVLAVVTMEGVFLVDGVQAPAWGRWRRVATVRAPLARDVALTLTAAPGRVVWTDHDGVYGRALRRDGGRLLLGAPRQLAAPPTGEQARYPVAALAHAGGLAVLWTADRRDLALAEDRPWGTGADAAPVPRACADGEHLDGLHWCLETEQTGWLLCRTDRRRLLAARWDLTLNEGGCWLDLAPPVPPAAAAFVCLGGAPFAIMATAAGDLLSLNVRAAAAGAGEWHSIDRPAQIRAVPPPRALAVGALHDRPGVPGWLALAGTGGLWAVPVARSGDLVECGTPVNVWTGE